MKLPRWLVISLLGMTGAGAIAILAAGICWWVRWPERTAREFAELLVARQLEEASRMVGCEEGSAADMTLYNLQSITKQWQDATLDRRARTLVDVVLARQVCQVRSDYTISSGKPTGLGPHPELEHGLRFVVGRGKVSGAKRLYVLINQSANPDDVQVIEGKINGVNDVIDSSWNSCPIVRDPTPSL